MALEEFEFGQFYATTRVSMIVIREEDRSFEILFETSLLEVEKILADGQKKNLSIESSKP
ncbi:MAG: hypothetical protein WB988_04340 [Candidatus Nitrosopolaris sp.]